MEALQILCEWNPGWTPKYFICDFSEEQITAVENVFPNVFILISDHSREKAWSDWLSCKANGMSEHEEEVKVYLEAIAQGR